jgi:hypothetical protein
LAPLPEGRNPVLTRQHISDVPAAFVADPFMLRVQGTWYMFFEVMQQQTRQGAIGLAVSTDGVHWEYQHLVLVEPFHLSYPYVFAWQGAYYMVPESYEAGAIRLYQAAPFPTRWVCIATLLQGPYFVDTSLFRYHDIWWFFTDASPALRHDTLRLYYAADLVGPWHEHPHSPIVAGNGHIARPAGRVVVLPDGVMRYTQDCDSVYGSQVRAFRSTVLTTTSYQEHLCLPAPVLTGSGAGWNRDGMHHLDPHILDNGQWLACVDGFTTDIGR